VLAALATFFLLMSNVGATALLVPLATSNSLLIPMHQVSALLMGPGGNKMPDFMKAGWYHDGALSSGHVNHDEPVILRQIKRWKPIF